MLMQYLFLREKVCMINYGSDLQTIIKLLINVILLVALENMKLKIKIFTALVITYNSQSKHNNTSSTTSSYSAVLVAIYKLQLSPLLVSI